LAAWRSFYFYRAAGEFGVGVAGAGVTAGGAVGDAGVSGGAMRVAAGGVTLLDAVWVLGSCPMPKATANTTTMNTAAAIHPHVAFMARASGS
jgi:hypothetical protein